MSLLTRVMQRLHATEDLNDTLAEVYRYAAELTVKSRQVHQHLDLLSEENDDNDK